MFVGLLTCVLMSGSCGLPQAAMRPDAEPRYAWVETNQCGEIVSFEQLEDDELVACYLKIVIAPGQLPRLSCNAQICEKTCYPAQDVRENGNITWRCPCGNPPMRNP